VPILPDKLPTESAKAYAAFVAYCELGTQRSQETVSKQLAKSRQFISRWSAVHNWQSRVADYDRAIALERADDLRTLRRADVERLRTQNTDDAATLRTLARALTGKLARRIGTMDEQGIEVKDLAPLLRALATTLDTATNLEASALGITDLMRLLDDGDMDSDSKETPARRVGERDPAP